MGVHMQSIHLEDLFRGVRRICKGKSGHMIATNHVGLNRPSASQFILGKFIESHVD